VKWSLHAREEIIFELLRHLRGNTTRIILESIKKSTRVMLEEQEAVRGRLFTIQDVMQSTVRAWLQARISIPNFHISIRLKPHMLGGVLIARLVDYRYITCPFTLFEAVVVASSTYPLINQFLSRIEASEYHTT
jgi:hypothetical protein